MGQLTVYAQALIASVTIGVIVPLVILVLMLAGIWRLVILAQRKGDFQVQQVFTDPETGKVTVSRFTILMAFAISTWYLAVDAFAGQKTPEFFYAYLAAWSNSLTLLTLAQRWDGALPFAKGRAPQ